MIRITEVDVPARSLALLEPSLGEERIAALRDRAESLRAQLGSRRVWNVNSTAAGGGVAEMLATLIGYPRAAGIETRWLVTGGEERFFHVTKRLHHALHGSGGDESRLGDDARRIYENVIDANAADLVPRLEPGDIVILHDPQTAGLIPALRAAGVFVVWRSHIGSGHWNDNVELGWNFLLPYVSEAPVCVFSRDAYVPPQLEGRMNAIIAPSIDPIAAKNEALDASTVAAILARCGLVGAPRADAVRFAGGDGGERVVDREADVVRDGGPVAADVPLILQVSRWDPLKDPIGVIEGFARMSGPLAERAVLMLAGPGVTTVADDPEAVGVLEAVVERWRALPDAVRGRVHLVSLPMDDIVENASMVNALQRHATVVVQKSLQEGFGLTVSEAMWKYRPVVASAVGGIQDQIVDRVSGRLLTDPHDTVEFASTLDEVLADPDGAAAMGKAAFERVRDSYTPVRHLHQYADLLERFLADGA